VKDMIFSDISDFLRFASPVLLSLWLEGLERMARALQQPQFPACPALAGFRLYLPLASAG